MNKDSLNEKMMEAIEKQDMNVLKMAIEYGADVNCIIGKGYTPLLLSVVTNNVEAFKYLVSKGADVKQRIGDKKQSLLYYACTNNQINLDLIKVILKESGVEELKYRPLNGSGIRDVLASNKELKEAIENRLTIEEKMQLRKIENLEREYFRLFESIEYEDMYTIKKLIEKGLDPNYTLPNGYTPLLLCIEKNNLIAFQYLLENGADVTQRIGNSKESLLHYACVKEDVKLKIIDLIVEYGGLEEINYASTDDKSPYAESNDILKAYFNQKLGNKR